MVKKSVLLLLLLIVSAVSLFGQQAEPMELISSDWSRIDNTTGKMINYRPVYRHKGSSLGADSGYLYKDELNREFFDAFGNIRITNPDGTEIYANKLNYAAETQLAILTGNVRMVDGTSTLTTNYLTYNMRNSTGTYTGGGRIVNQTDTITSKNAWYFNQTKDAYFRYDVIVRTPDVQIFTDTMRYNSDEKTTYFYGPTNMKGKDGENLYTEEGYYNTETELAEFFKNNLYTETTRFLRGDTLYYDGKQGIGRALNNVLFVDTADQSYLAEGQFGLYNKAEESILMTGQPLVTMVMDDEESGGDSPAADSVAGRTEPETRKVDSVYLTADTLYSRMIFLRDYIPMDFKLDREGGELEQETTDFTEGGEFGEPDIMGLPGEPGADLPERPVGLDSLGSDSLKRDTLWLDPLRQDSLGLDSVGLDSFTPDSVRLDALRSDSLLSDTLRIDRVPPVNIQALPKPKPADSAVISKIETDLAADSVLRQQVMIPTGMEADSLMSQAVLAAQKAPPPDSLIRDSLHLDTAKTRIIKAYRNVRLFKSDLQAVGDSVYYGYPDSMMRFFGSPMAWAQGSQMSGDSLYLQIKNEKIDNMLLLGNAFIVNTKRDSAKYTQIKGRKITGFFLNGDLERAFVDGNAESLTYLENKSKTNYTDMYHNRSSRIKLVFKDKELSDFIPIRRAEGTLTPIHLLRQDQEILDGFIWKPGDRPRSKEDLLARKRAAAEPVALDPPDPDAADPDAITDPDLD